jgi:4-amino-4-deoxy-L-arabinose transferase-like glycosyltransferase
MLGGIWAIAAVVDRTWFALDQSIPAWDQAEYLTGAMNFWRALQQPHWFSSDWWTNFWMLSSKIPPFVYLSTTPFISLFGAGEEQSTLVNLLYSAILLSSVYGLGVRLFSLEVGLWAAGLCLLLPGLYTIRLDYLIDYPLVAIVTLTFFWLTLWATSKKPPVTESESPSVEQPSVSSVSQSLAIMQSIALPGVDFAILQPWLLAALFGLALGFAFLTKQPALFFLITPIVWLAIVAIKQRSWRRLLQLMFGLTISTLVFLPWYRTNWLIILTSGTRATVTSAIAEGDPPFTSIGAWTFYLAELPGLVSIPIFVVGLVGLVLYWKRSVIRYQWSVAGGRLTKTIDYGGLRKKGYRREMQRTWRKSVRWLLIFLVGSYLLSSFNVNKDARYITPLLPILTILLAQGLVLFPDRLRGFRWGAIGLSILLMLVNLAPIEYSPKFLLGKHPHHAVLSSNWHQEDMVNDVIEAEPYLSNTIGVLPSLAEFNQHNLNYAGVLRNFQVYGRQVGTQIKQVEQDARSLSWFVTKEGSGGAIRKSDAYSALTKTISESPDFRLYNSWTLPDKTRLNLYRRQVAPIRVEPSSQPPGNVKLEQIRVPNRAAPGKPMPITYRWSGTWAHLRSGIVLLTWTRTKTDDKHQITQRWYHDHAIALGHLHSSAADDPSQFQVTERLSALPPQDAQGTYTLKAAYLNRDTGETYKIDVPDITLTITADTPDTPAPEVDFATQLRSLAATMPKGIQALDRIFTEVGRLSQYDATQDYVTQARRALEYRLKREPNAVEFAYGLALANVLKRRVQPAIETLERVTQLDSQNPNAYAYLAFVNLYDFRPHAAQTAINSALALNPDVPELHKLNAVAGLMKGNLIQAWQEFRK